MRWLECLRGGREGSWTNKLYFHDLVDDDDRSLGWVREDTRVDPPICQPMTNTNWPRFPAYDSLEEAKAVLLAHFVAKKLEGHT